MRYLWWGFKGSCWSRRHVYLLKPAPAPVREESVRGKPSECSTGDKGAFPYISEQVWGSGGVGDNLYSDSGRVNLFFPLLLFILSVCHTVHASAFLWLSIFEVHHIQKQTTTENDTIASSHLPVPRSDGWLNGCVWMVWPGVAFSTNPTGSSGSPHWLSSETQQALDTAAHVTYPQQWALVTGMLMGSRGITTLLSKYMRTEVDLHSHKLRFLFF